MKINEFLQDDNTQRFSAIRLVLLSWSLGVLMVWSYASLNSKKVENLPQSVQVVLLTLMAGKVVQKFGESSSTSDSDETKVGGKNTSDQIQGGNRNGSLDGQVISSKNGNHGSQDIPATSNK